MKRRDFFKLFSTIPLFLASMNICDLEKISQQFPKTDKFPILFIGHGSPMNALFDNQFTQTLQQIGKRYDKPNAIMVVSAHWLTRGTFVSVNPNPKTIYDFGGFDERLFQIKYEPAGHSDLAREVINQLPIIKEDTQMGLDHGAWTVLKFLFPNADIPVFQLSIDYYQSPKYHFEIGQALQKMREKGVLIISSGNIVHNLRQLDWRNIDAKPFDWAVEFDEIVKQKLNDQDFQALVEYEKLGNSFKMAVPTNDHYLPMLYTIGLATENETVKYLYEGLQHASISMRCFEIS